jgi:hypothetical protein
MISPFAALRIVLPCTLLQHHHIMLKSGHPLFNRFHYYWRLHVAEGFELV